MRALPPTLVTSERCRCAELGEMELLEGEHEESASSLLGLAGGLSNSRTEAAVSAGDRFDASQYAFFGQGVTQEVEIGGLDEEDEAEGLETKEDVDDAFALGDMRSVLDGSTKGEDDTESSVSVESRPSGYGGAVASEPFESSSVANWMDAASQENEVEQGGRKWWPNNQLPTPGVEGEGNPWPSSQQIPQRKPHRWGSDLSTVSSVAAPAALHPPKRSHPMTQAPSPGQFQMLRTQTPLAQGALPGMYGQPFPSLQPALGVMPSIAAYGAGPPLHYNPLTPLMTQQAASMLWSVQPNNMQTGPVTGSGAPQLPQHTVLLPPQVLLQYQHPFAPQAHSPLLSPYPPVLKAQLPPHAMNVSPAAPQIFSKVGLMAGDARDHSQHRGRQFQHMPQHHSQHGTLDGNFSDKNAHFSSWQPLRSKYMTVEEIENIVRIQWAATHSSDPYVDDYYHQAVQSKLLVGFPHGRRQFAPSHLRELPSHTRAAVEPHAFLQVDALGRVPFSSIRRPRPLLEVDSAAGRLVGSKGRNSVPAGVAEHRPLEQEPMLAARIAIEDGLCLLLDVDDVDRLLSSSQPLDGGAQLKRRRQLLLEGLASLMQLVDTNNVYAGRSLGHSSTDDHVFMRLVSLPKGQKLLTRYLLLLLHNPGNELIRIVVLAMFRHLRFLFGSVSSDPDTLSSVRGLANAAAGAVMTMDLPTLSACLGAVVSAPDQPPLRPTSNPAGDGASVVLRAVLERATGLLTSWNAAYPMQNRAVWQASFDAFFGLLAKYCTNKYDSIFHSLMMTSPGNANAINNAAAIEMSKEMPVELLRASLPHTNDHQRKVLLEFAQRSMGP